MFDINALKKIPKTTEPPLVRKLYQQAVEESVWALWGILKFVRDEHADILMTALADVEDSQVQLVRAGFDLAGAAGIRAAGEYFSYIRSSSHLPGLLKRLQKDHARFDELLPIAKEGLRRTITLEEEPDIVSFWGLVFLVKVAVPSDPLLAEVQAANERWQDEHGVWDRVTKAAAKIC